MPDQPPLLEVRIERKTFATGREVLRDVAFSVAPGEVVALLGPSGTGKSTTLRILLGLETGFSGSVRSRGGRTGVMFQEPRLLPWLTVAENVALVVTDAVPPVDVAGLLDEVELAHAAGLYPRQISLGMARRAALARALAVSSALLVLDEPFASLDPGLAARLAAAVTRRARAHGTAVVLATHDLAQALEHASRLLVLAGAPASLAADVALPAGIDAAARRALQAKLAAQFAFLGPSGLPADCRSSVAGLG